MANDTLPVVASGGKAPSRRARISPCGSYREWLEIIWDNDLQPLPVVMLNPSNADAVRDDPTVLSLKHFATLWGHGGLLIANLYDFRSPSPAVMMREPNRVSPNNVRALGDILLFGAIFDGLLVAWGNDGDFEGAASRLVARARDFDTKLICLGTTKSGAPKHPLARGKHRIPRDQQPMVWPA